MVLLVDGEGETVVVALVVVVDGVDEVVVVVVVVVVVDGEVVGNGVGGFGMDSISSPLPPKKRS